MARTVQRLTAVFVSKAKKRGVYCDGAGLILRVAPGGSRQWQFRYRFGGKERYMGLGGVQTFSLAEARVAARHARQLLHQGIDPIEDRRSKKKESRHAQVTTVTFEQACKRYIMSHKASWKSAKHCAQWCNTLANYSHPICGDMDVRDVDTDTVFRVLEPIWIEKPETAGRLRGRIESVLDWATVRGYRAGDNPARWKGHLQALLPARSKIRRVRHHPALGYAELSSFYGELLGRSGTSARALEFTILTVARSGETTGATWEEIDLGERVWTITAERMKMDRPHTVPLSERAVMILKNLRDSPGANTFVFQGPFGDRLSNMAMLQLLKRMGRRDITVHGFRSTFRDWAGDCTTYPREVIEQALAHKIGGVEGAYRRSDALEKRRRLLTAWADFAAREGSSSGDPVSLSGTGS